jgi:hypothetical protein
MRFEMALSTTANEDTGPLRIAAALAFFCDLALRPTNEPDKIIAYFVSNHLSLYAMQPAGWKATSKPTSNIPIVKSVL